MRSRSALLSCGCWRLRFPAGLKVPGLFPRSSKYEPGFSSCVFLSCCIFMLFIFAVQTSRYPLRGYILGVLTNTTTWDRQWGGDETTQLLGTDNWEVMKLTFISKFWD